VHLERYLSHPIKKKKESKWDLDGLVERTEKWVVNHTEVQSQFIVVCYHQASAYDLVLVPQNDYSSATLVL